MSMDTSMSSTNLYSRRNIHTPILDQKWPLNLITHYFFFHNCEEKYLYSTQKGDIFHKCYKTFYLQQIGRKWLLYSYFTINV